ncbi:hypothetical protein AAFF_G00078920 [Aldrovandia affinis]|uniref:Uncharacterized protein n=1 Tax=Aldrovandia affinis TaxID=143900 RepID=A0AAD7RX91_9TELE|nr:hypothetical protein AAFF_G00078920 [Aldrovandia affinis]
MGTALAEVNFGPPCGNSGPTKERLCTVRPGWEGGQPIPQTPHRNKRGGAGGAQSEGYGPLRIIRFVPPESPCHTVPATGPRAESPAPTVYLPGRSRALQHPIPSDTQTNKQT